jgi:hypothetical protein
MGPYSYYDIATLPRLRHVVWCSVPNVETGEPGTTVRPALVYSTKYNKTTHHGAVCVFYGTQSLNLPHSIKGDLVIQKAERLAELDLPTAIRFDLGLSNWLPWAYEFFRPPEHSIYVVAGPLSDAEVGRYRACLARRGIISAM